MSQVYSIKELRKVILEIDGCKAELDVTFVDGTTGKNPCTMEQMCDECILKFAGLLEWAEDMEEEELMSKQLELPLMS